MCQKSTRKKAKDCCNVLKDERPVNLSPGKDTLAFVMQFAYTYHVEKDLPISLSGMILN